MCLSLHENRIDVHAAIPSQTNGLRAFCLLQSPLIKLPCVRVVVVYGGDGGIGEVEFFAGVEDEYRQMLDITLAYYIPHFGGKSTFKTMSFSSVMLSGCTQYFVVCLMKFC